MADDDLSEVLREVTDAVGDVTGDQAPAVASEAQFTAAERSAFPTEMSCSQAFDQLLKCYSLGGQARHYYRYGEVALCQDKRAKMKFCLGTKFKGEDARRAAVAQWYMRQLAENKAARRTSEQVWSARAEPLRRPFREDVAELLGVELE